MAQCILVVILWAIIAVIVLALVETGLRLMWPVVPVVVLFLLRALCGILILLWVLGCVSHFPGPPGLPR